MRGETRIPIGICVGNKKLGGNGMKTETRHATRLKLRWSSAYICMDSQNKIGCICMDSQIRNYTKLKNLQNNY